MARRGTSPQVKTNTAEDLNGRLARITGHYYNRSWMARWPRRATNLANWDAYHHRMDWSHKKPWQTQQTLPDFGIAVEQTVGAFEKALTDSDDWLVTEAVGIGDPPLDADTIQHWLLYYLTRLWIPGNQAETSYGVASLVADSMKRAILESIFTWKIYARFVDKVRYRLEPGDPKETQKGHRDDLEAHDLTPHGTPSKKVQKLTTRDFRLCIDLIPFEDYFPDPSLQNVYEIHEVTRNLTDLLANRDYDPDVVKTIQGSANTTLADAYKRRTQNIPFVQHDSWEVRVRECWGDVIDPVNGDVLETNVFWTECQGKILRPPTPNPFWHGQRPFVSTPLLPTPNSTVHRALADAAVGIWRFMNEQISLMMDGALASVWGVHQVRPDLLEYPEEISDGIPQASALTLRPNTPDGLKAVERIDEGEAPEYGIEMFNIAQREFQQAMMANDLAQGQLPQREVKATEIVESMQARGSLLESVSARVEDRHLNSGFELAWMTILQYEDDIIEPELVQILGPERTMAISKLSPEDRFVLLAQGAKFKVRGLRAVAAKNRLATKLANILQLTSQDEQLGQILWQKYSQTRFAELLLRTSGIDPTTIEKTPQEMQADQQQQDQQAAQQMVEQARMDAAGGAPGGGGNVPGAAGPPGPPGQGGSPPALVNASQDQQNMGAAMAPKNPTALPPGATGAV